MKYGPLNDRIKSASPLLLDKDFIKLNRIGIKKGIVTASGQKQVKATRCGNHRIRVVSYDSVSNISSNV